MNVLYWTTSFPNYSETFIRNQITGLIDHNINVLIYTDIKRLSDTGSLKNFESYNLLERTTSREELYPKNKAIRVIKALLIVFRSLFTKKTKYYLRSINVSKYGYKAKSLHHFYVIHFFLKNNIDIIHAHFGTNGNTVSVYKDMGLPIKLICTFHGYDIRLGEREPKDFYEKLFLYATKIISISSYNYNKLLEFGCEQNKIIHINNGVSIPKMEPNKVNNEIIKILSVGRLVEDKAYHLALNALSEFLLRYPDINWSYNIIGGGVLENDLKKLSKELNLTDKVVFHLEKDSKYVSEMMQDSDFLLLTSINEAIPTVILEAQALSLPVIATNVGAISDLVINNKTGFLVDTDIKSIKRGLFQMLDNRDQWDFYGTNAKQIIIEKYNSKREILKLINMCKTCLDE